MFKHRTNLAMSTPFIITIMTIFIILVSIIGVHTTNVKNTTNAKDLKLQNKANPSTITSNTYTGTGAPLSWMEYGDSKNTTTGLSLVGSQTINTSIRLANQWTGYKLNTYVYNIYETHSWVQYYNFPHDGNTGDYVNNGYWHYQENNTRANGGEVTGGGGGGASDYVWVDCNPGDNYNFYTNDNASWYANVYIPRGTIVSAKFAYDYYTGTYDGCSRSPYADFTVYGCVNNVMVLSMPGPQLGTTNTWLSSPLEDIPSAVVAAFPSTPAYIKVRVGCFLDSAIGYYEPTPWNMYCRFDNIRFYVTTLTRSTDANLTCKVDSDTGGRRAIPSTSYGTGNLTFHPTPSNWVAGTNYLDINSVFRTNSTNTIYSTLETTYEQSLQKVTFYVDQTIYGRHLRNTQIGTSSLSSNGTTFVAANNSKINWTMYYYDRPPQITTGKQANYIDYMFNGSKPADWKIYSVIDSQPYNTTANLVGGANASIFITMPKAYAGYYGYWTFSAWSPNYVQSMAVPSTIYQGKSLRINATIKATNMTDKYVSSTKAMLTIEFPNGTAWASATELASATNRQVTFPAITIPSSGSNYVAGTYTAIVTWNNTRSGYPLNETGCMVRTFMVFHNATIMPQYTTYSNNLNTQTALPIELRYVDTGGNDISGALITFTNFNSVTQNFTHVSGYYNYLTLLDCTNGKNGLNTITITATSFSYQPLSLSIKIEVVRTTNFIIDQYPSVTSQWNDNFSLTLHYKDAKLGTGIGISSKNNITVTWLQEVGKFWINMAQNSSGIFTIVFNTTGTIPNTIYSVPIMIKQLGYQNQTVTMSITINPRLTYFNLVPISSISYGLMMNVSGTYKEISSGILISNKTNSIRTYAWITGGPNCTVTNFGGTTKTTFTFTLNSSLLSALGSYTLNVNIRWRGQPYYQNQTSTLQFSVVQRPTTLSYSSLQPTPLYQPVSCTITYVDTATGTGVYKNVVVSKTTAGVTLTSAVYQGNGVYAITITNAGLLTYGSHNVVFNFNITTSTAPFYANNTITVTIQITTRSTQIVYSGLVPTSYGQQFDFTVQVQDVLNGTSITGIGASSFSSNASTNFKMYSESPAGTYHIHINTTQLSNIGSVKYWINVVPGSITKYSNANLTITFTAVNRAVSLSAGSVPVTNFGQLITFTVQYSDGINSTGLAGHESYLNANWTGKQFISLGGGLYNFTIPASDFSILRSYGVNINATWPSSTKPFYAYALITVHFTITNRASTLTASKESNPQFGDNMTIDITFQDGINSSYININRVTQLSVSVVGNNGSVTMVRTGTNGVYKVYISTKNLPATGSYAVSITASWSGKPFYVNQTQTLTVTVTQRNSVLILTNPSQVYTTYGYNVKFHVSLGYLDVANGSTISKTTAVITRVNAKYGASNVTTITNVNTVINYSLTVGWTINFNSANFVTPSSIPYTVTVQFNWSASMKPFYTNNVIRFNITMSVSQTQIAQFGSLTAQKGQNQTIYFEYINSQSGQPIAPTPAPSTNITVTMPGVGSVSNGTSKLYYTTGGKRYVIWNGTAAWNGTCYKLPFNATILGSLTPFNILFAKGTNYNQANSNYTLVDSSVGSQLQLISVQTNRILGQNISMVVAYTYQGTSNTISHSNLTVAKNVTSLYWGKNEYSYTTISSTGYYNLTVKNTGPAYRINTINFYTIYVTMYSTITENATVNVQFQMQQIPTNISKVLFNNKDYTSNATYPSLPITKSLNITVEFDQLFPNKANITDAKVVYLMSSSLPSNLNFTLVGGRWSLILPASKLGVGTAFLFVIAQKGNYQQSSKTLLISVTQVSTSLAVYLNGTQRSSIQVNWGQSINVSALYKNTVDNTNITDTNAHVTLTGGSHDSTFTLTTSVSWWRIAGNLGSALLGPPASYTMTLSASRVNFTTSSAVFTIVVVQVPTTLTSVGGAGNYSITINWSATFTIGLTYMDSNNAVISNAVLTSSPNVNISTQTFTGGNYYLQYNSSRFGLPQVYNLVISVVKGNYTSQSITFSVTINAIPTTLKTYVYHGLASTNFAMNWKDCINVSVQFMDIMHIVSGHGKPISGASISVGSFNKSITLTKYTSGNYTLQFNSTLLGTPGVYILSITFNKTNYATAIVAITIQVTGPGTTLIPLTSDGKNLNTQVTLYYGQSFVFVVKMYDNDHNVNLSSWTPATNPAANTSVQEPTLKQNWTFTYNGLLPGIHTITVTGSKVNFTQASLVIMVQVNSVPTTLVTYAYNGKSSSSFTVQWGYEIGVTVQYLVTQINNSVISPASAVITTTYNSNVRIIYTNAQNTTFIYNASKFVPGVYTITLAGNRSHYVYASWIVTLTVTSLATTLATMNSTTHANSTSFTATWGNLVSFDIAYNQTSTLNSFALIPGVITTSPFWTSTANDKGRLTVIFNTTAIGSPNIYSITISAQYANRTSQSVVVSLTINRVLTSIFTYNSSNNIATTYNVYWNDQFSIDLLYQTISPMVNLTTLAGTTVTSSYTPVSQVNSLHAGRLNITFSTSTLAIQIYQITLTVARANYTSASISMLVNVLPIPTIVTTYNYTTGFSNSQFKATWNTLINISVQFYRTYKIASIAGATIQANPLDVSYHYVSGKYVFTFNSSKIGSPGIYSITFTASMTNFVTSAASVTLEVLSVQTRVNINLTATAGMPPVTTEATNITISRQYFVPFQNNITIRLQYLKLSSTPLAGARVMIRYLERKLNWTNYNVGNTSISIIQNMTGLPYEYYLTLNTTTVLRDYSQYSFVVIISLANYTLQSQTFYVYPLKRQTEMYVYDSSWNLVYTGQKFTINYTHTFEMYCSLIDLSSGKAISDASYSAVMKGVTFTPDTSYTNHTAAKFVFNSSRLNVDVGTSNYISLSGTAGIYNPSGSAINLEVLTVPTNITLSRDYGSGNVTAITGSIMENVTWSGNVTLRVYYHNMLNNSNITNPTIQVLIGTLLPISGIWNGVGHYSTIVIDTTSLSGGNTYTVFVSGYLQNYTSAQFPFNLYVNLAPAKLWAMNDAQQFKDGDLLKVYYGDVLRLNFTYQDLLNKHNITLADAGGVSIIHAIVLGTTINATYQTNGKWLISINTGLITGLQAGSTPQVLVTGSYPNFQQQVFSFNMQVLNIPTALVIPITFQNVMHYTWGQSFTFTVGYNDTHNKVLISGTLVANYPAQISYIGSNFTLVFNTTLIGSPGIYRITLTANRTNYAPASYMITVQIGEVPTSIQVLFNDLSFLTVALKQNVTILINYTRTDTHVGIYNPHIVVTVNFTNDLTGALIGYSSKTLQIQNNSNGLYWVVINLDLKTFYAQPKFVIVQAYLENYSLGKANPVIYLKPIDIIPSQNLNKNNPNDMNIPDLAPGTTVTFDFTMLDNSTGLGFTDMSQIRANITCNALNIFNMPMKNLGDGTFEYTLTLPNVYNATYTVTVEVYVGNGTIARQFNFQNEYTFHFSTMVSRTGQDLTWLVISLIIGIIVIAAWFILYQVRFKYPLIIRKIHDLQRSVRRGKAAAKIPSQKVSSREEGIYSEFAKILNKYSFLQTRAKSMATSAKKEKAVKGYVAPGEKDTLAKEFDLSTEEKVVEIKSVAPAIMPKEGPKKYVEPPTVPAPIAQPTEEEEPVAKSAAPKMPTIAKPGALKPPALAAIPKPTAKPMPKQGIVVPSEGEGKEGLYGELVKLEQKKYKAQGSLRDLKAKKEKGILTDEEFTQYEARFEEALEKINEKISEIRRKLVNF